MSRSRQFVLHACENAAWFILVPLWIVGRVIGGAILCVVLFVVFAPWLLWAWAEDWWFGDMD